MIYFYIEMIETGKLVLPTNHKMFVGIAEILMCLIMLCTLTLPFGVAASIYAEIEPIHHLIYEWLEVEFEMSLGFSPFICVMFIASYAVAWAVCLMVMVIFIYYMTCSKTIHALIPKRIYTLSQMGKGRCELLTEGFGLLPDDMVIYLYRVQQRLNIELNAFFMSPLVAFHHVGSLATLVAFLLVAIRYNHILDAYGATGYLFVFSGIAAFLVILYAQSKMVGSVVDISKDFRFSGMKLVPRTYMFRKFTKCCSPFYIQVAYSFYTVHKGTFRLFCEQTLDYAILLLLYES